jgi:hypothetical protein
MERARGFGRMAATGYCIPVLAVAALVCGCGDGRSSGAQVVTMKTIPVSGSTTPTPPVLAPKGNRTVRKLPGGGTAYLPPAPTATSVPAVKGCVSRRGLPYPVPPAPGAKAHRDRGGVVVVVDIAPGPVVCAPFKVQVQVNSSSDTAPPFVRYVRPGGRHHLFVRVPVSARRLQSIDFVRVFSLAATGGASDPTEVAVSD